MKSQKKGDIRILDKKEQAERARKISILKQIDKEKFDKQTVLEQKAEDNRKQKETDQLFKVDYTKLSEKGKEKWIHEVSKVLADEAIKKK